MSTKELKVVIGYQFKPILEKRASIPVGEVVKKMYCSGTRCLLALVERATGERYTPAQLRLVLMGCAMLVGIVCGSVVVFLLSLLWALLEVAVKLQKGGRV